MEAGDVRGAGSREAALDRVHQAVLAACRQLEGDGRVQAASVAGAHSGVSGAPVSLLHAWVEHEHVASVPLHDHGSRGADDDDDPAGLGQRVRAHGGDDLLREAFPRERIPHLQAGLAEFVRRRQHRQAVGVLGEQQAGERRPRQGGAGLPDHGPR